MPGKPLSVALVGGHDPEYPRNRAMRAALLFSGHRVLDCHSRAPFPLRHWVLLRQYFRLRSRVDLIFVTEGGHRLVPLVRLLALTTGKRVVFDPFLSRYSTRIEDRRLHSPKGLQAWISRWQDWSSTHAAHGLLFDTFEHREYFRSRYRLDKPFAVIPVGADEELFDPDRYRKADGNARDPGRFEVLFYGTYIPLQGIEHILEAASLIEKAAPDVTFRLIGEGQTYPEMRAIAERLGLRNVVFEPLLPASELPGRIAAARVCLGIFGTTLKTQNVVPNKVVQAAAMGAAILTADTPAVRRYFRNGENAVLVPPGDGEAIAEALLRLRSGPHRLDALRSGSRRAFLEHFSLERQAAILDAFLREILAEK